MVSAAPGSMEGVWLEQLTRRRELKFKEQGTDAEAVQTIVCARIWEPRGKITSTLLLEDQITPFLRRVTHYLILTIPEGPEWDRRDGKGTDVNCMILYCMPILQSVYQEDSSPFIISLSHRSSINYPCIIRPPLYRHHTQS